MSHWEGFGTLPMATDTSNALLDPVLYMGRTQCANSDSSTLALVLHLVLVPTAHFLRQAVHPHGLLLQVVYSASSCASLLPGLEHLVGAYHFGRNLKHIYGVSAPYLIPIVLACMSWPNIGMGHSSRKAPTEVREPNWAKGPTGPQSWTHVP